MANPPVDPQGPNDPPNQPNPTSPLARAPPRYKEMTEKQRSQALLMLVGAFKDGKLPHGQIANVARKIGVTRASISKLWKAAPTTRASGVFNSPEARSKRCLRGRGSIYNKTDARRALKEIPRSKRTSLRKTATAMGVSHKTVQRWIKSNDGPARKHNNRLKPTLKDDDKMSRITMALSMRNPDNLGVFKDFSDTIHVDEKWFYLSTDKQVYYLADDEEDPYRHVQHKSHITKIMFLAAVAWPRYDHHKKQQFDGKIGIWPIGKFVPAKRNSKKRPKGTPIWKNENVTKEVYRDILIDKLIPAIKQRFPKDRHQTIIIQQDGAKSHIGQDDEEFAEALEEEGLDAKLMTQSANSPDTNLLDLGFFRAIQSFNDAAPNDEKELIDAVTKAYNEYPFERINRTWLTLQSCFNCILDNDGGNDYKIPHMAKVALDRRGELPLVLAVTESAKRWADDEEDEEEEDEEDDDDSDEEDDVETMEEEDEGHDD